MGGQEEIEMEIPRKEKIPNYGEIIARIMEDVQGPIPVEQLATQILEQRLSQARDLSQAALNKIQEEVGRQLVYLDNKQVLPLRLAYQGVRYHLRLDKQIVDRAAIPLAIGFEHYHAPHLDREDLRWMDYQGHPISAQIQEIKRPSPIFQNEEYSEAQVMLRDWFHSQPIYVKDHLLVTVIDWELGVFLLERDRYSDRQSELLARRNRALADILFDMLESSPAQELYVHEAIPTAYARLPNKRGYAAEHWAVIISEDPRLITDGSRFHYPDSGYSMLERMVMEMNGESAELIGKPFSREEGQQVYRLRAELARRPSIWREVEVQGKQSLADLEGVLRAAFNLDTSDHLSGFWQRVAREGRARRRYREVELGDEDCLSEQHEEHFTEEIVY
jgi:hypothetical protein